MLALPFDAFGPVARVAVALLAVLLTADLMGLFRRSHFNVAGKVRSEHWRNRMRASLSRAACYEVSLCQCSDTTQHVLITGGSQVSLRPSLAR